MAENDENKSSLGARIKEIRKKYGFTRSEFALNMKVSYDSQETYENNRATPSTEYWRLFEETTSPADLVYVITGEETMPVENLRRIPILGTINAGSLRQGFRDEDIIDWVWTTKVKNKDAFGLKVVGDSMVPMIQNGDYVLCDPAKQFISGKIYAVVAGDSEHTVKQVFKEPGGYRLQPANPDYASTFIADSDMIKLVRCVQAVSDWE